MSHSAPETGQQDGGRLQSEGFINRPMSLALDFVRGFAAVLVLMGHMVQQEIYTGPRPFGAAIQHNAVVVFFVLSGLVIANSAFSRRAQAGASGLGAYALTRFVRVMPVAIMAVVLGLMVFALGQWLDISVINHGQSYGVLSWQAVVLPLLFLSEASWGTGPVWNPPYWSLVYEVWYYALFGAALFLRGWKRWLALPVLALLAGLKVLLLLPIWLAGVALARFAPARPLPQGLALVCCCIGLGLMPFTNRNALPASDLLVDLTGLEKWQFGMSAYALTDWIFGLGIALFFLGLRPIADGRAATLERFSRPIRWLAECSFTLYLIHWPILNLMHGLEIGAGDNPLLFILIVAAIIALASQVARVTEHRRGDLRRWIAARLPHGKGGAGGGAGTGAGPAGAPQAGA